MTTFPFIALFFVYGSPAFVLASLAAYYLYQFLTRAKARRHAVQPKRQLSTTQPDPVLEWDRNRAALEARAAKKYQIGRGGEHLGEMTVAEIHHRLESHELTMEDFYFDEDANDWMPLDCLADLARKHERLHPI